MATPGQTRFVLVLILDHSREASRGSRRRTRAFSPVVVVVVIILSLLHFFFRLSLVRRAERTLLSILFLILILILIREFGEPIPPHRRRSARPRKEIYLPVRPNLRAVIH